MEFYETALNSFYFLWEYILHSSRICTCTKLRITCFVKHSSFEDVTLIDIQLIINENSGERIGNLECVFV